MDFVLEVGAPLLSALVLALGILHLGGLVLFAGSLSLWVTLVLSGRPLAVAAVWLIAVLYEEVVHDATVQDVFLGQLGSILLLPMDVPYFLTLACLFVGALLRPEQTARVIRAYPFLTWFLILIIASVVIYTPQYGKQSIGEARKAYFFFLFPFLALVSVHNHRDVHRILMFVCGTAAVLSLCGYVLLFVSPAAMASMRPISAGGALFLLFATFAIVVSHSNRMVVITNTVDNLMLLLFVPLIFIAHHRTVFLAGILGFLVYIAFQRQKGLFVLKAAVASLLAALVIGMVLTKAPTFQRVFVGALGGLIDPAEDETGAWRIEGWRQQLTPLSTTQLLIGKGLGSYYSWYNGTQEVEAEPHDAYVQLVLKFGVLGLAIYALFALSFFRTALSTRRKLKPGMPRAYIEMSILNVIGAHALMTGYDFSAIILIFYSIGMATIELCRDNNPDCLDSFNPRPVSTRMMPPNGRSVG
jgi:hypothetical protein